MRYERGTMNNSTYRFRVYSPPKAVLMLALMLVLCFAMLHLMDTYGYAWMKGRELRLFLLLIPVVAFYGLFGKLATNEMRVKMDANGLWLDNYPRWGWSQYDHLHIGWLELESWTWKKARLDGHSISWDRLSFRLTDGRKLLLLPTDDFDPITTDLPYIEGIQGNFPAFLANLEAGINDYNNTPTNHVPIRYGSPTSQVVVWAALRAALALAATLVIGYFLHRTLSLGRGGAGMYGAVFLLAFCCFLLIKNVLFIRNALKP